MGAFATALREGRFSNTAHGTFAESTVTGAISHVSSTFRENNQSNPTKDEDRELGILLSCQYRSFRNGDPNHAQQKAIPVSVIAEVTKKCMTEKQKAMGQLVVGSFICLQVL